MGTITGVVMLLDDKTGVPAALIDAEALTALRTAAGSAVATSILARKNSHVLVVFGKIKPQCFYRCVRNAKREFNLSASNSSVSLVLWLII